jgi:hypothetical protein
MACLNSLSIFTAIEEHFTALTSSLREPLMLVLSDAEVDEPRRMTLQDTRTITRDRGAALEDRDAIWRELVHRARREPEPWRLVAVWVMLPGLRAAAHRIAQSTRLDIADIRSALIAGFLEALDAVDPQRENLGSLLYWSSYNAARTACRAHDRELPTGEIERAAKPDDLPAMPVHRHVVTATQHVAPSGGLLEGERLGSIATRVGVADRLCPPTRCQRRALRPIRHDLHRRGVVVRVCASPVGKATAVSSRSTDAIKECR